MGWLIVEESLGVTGAGTLAILTSNEDYSFASGKKSAVKAKLASAKHCRHLLLAENIQAGFQDGSCTLRILRPVTVLNAPSHSMAKPGGSVHRFLRCRRIMNQ